MPSNLSLPTKLIAWLGAIIVGCLPVVVGAAVDVGQKFPPLADYALEGDVPAYQGHVTVVDFWASWCAPCKASFPAFDGVVDDFTVKGVVVVAVSVDKSAGAYRKFLDRLQPRFATVRDAAQRLVAEVAVPTMPTTYILDRQGVVRYIHRGFQGAGTVDELRQHISQLLEESP